MLLVPYKLDSVTIVGLGESAMDFVKKAWTEGQFWKPGELWGVNTAGYTFRCDKVWSMHDRATMLDPDLPKDFLRDLGHVPVVTLEDVPEIETCLVYPLSMLVKLFGTKNFKNTTAYMIAFALACGVKDLWLFGTEFNYHGPNEVNERHQHCLKYWIGRAEERGCRIHLPFGSALHEDEMYGFTTQPDFDMELMRHGG